MNIFYIPEFFSLLSLLNDASVDITDDEEFFQFFPEAEFTSHLYCHVTRATETEAESLLQCQKHAKTLIIQVVLNDLLLEIERSGVKLIW